jgi:diguanylate cyclase (GGDEF)-like protein
VLRDVRPDEARMLAERLVQAIRATTAVHMSHSLTMSVSVGLARRKEGDSPMAWVARADGALYRAKREGRDRWAEHAE